MTTTTAPTSDIPRADVVQFAVAGTFLDALATQDFDRLGSTLSPDAALRALLPSKQRDRTGAESIAAQFATWFGDTSQFDLVEATAGEVGGRIHLSWRIRLKAERLGPGWRVVEQQAYAECDEHGRIARIDLLCTGYRKENTDG